MILAILTFIIAISLSGVAAYYSIIGLIAIFSGATVSIAVMGGMLEVAKLLLAGWIYRNWHNELVPGFIRIYFMIALTILMLITSTGIFGYLSKAHIESSSNISTLSIDVKDIDIQIQSEQRQIDSLNKVISDMDASLEALYSSKQASRGTRELQKQTPERNRIRAEITKHNEGLQKLQLKKNELAGSIASEELKIGPIKYVAELLFSESDNKTLERSIRYLIMMLVFVFDPLAVLLVIAANISFQTLEQKSSPASPPKPKRRPKAVRVATTKDGKNWVSNPITDYLE